MTIRGPRLLGACLATAVLAVGATVPAAAAARVTSYHLNVFHEPGGSPAAEYTAFLDHASRTWSVEGRCDGGPYTKAGPALTLVDECQSETIYLVHARGRPGVWEGFGSYAFFELVKE